MGLRINTNVASINAQRNLTGSRLAQDRALSKLSSGERITKSADDAAGLAISENLKAQLRGLYQAKRNANDGISLVQTAEGGLNEVGNMLVRLRELGVQAASDTIGPQERGFLNVEYQQLKSEIERVVESTKFGDRHLLNGTGELMEIQVGLHNDAFLDRIGFDTSSNNAKISYLGIDANSVATKEEAQEGLAKIDNAIQTVAGIRANFGALQNRLQSTVNNIDIYNENLSAANSRIRDADMAYETSELARTNILLNSGVSVLSQANNTTALALKLLS
jgi:flagellin